MFRASILLAAVGAALAAAQPAVAGTVTVTGDGVRFEAKAGEDNDVTITTSRGPKSCLWEGCAAYERVDVRDRYKLELARDPLGAADRQAEGCTYTSPDFRSATCLVLPAARDPRSLVGWDVWGPYVDLWGIFSAATNLGTWGAFVVVNLGDKDDRLASSGPQLFASVDGGPGADAIDASGAAFSWIDGGGGADTMAGATISYAGRTAAVSMSANGAADDGAAGEGDNIKSAVAFVAGSGGDRLAAGAGTRFLAGAAGDDHLQGGTDTEMLQGGPGRDTLVGGPADERLYGQTYDGYYDDPDRTADTFDCGGGSDSAVGNATDTAAESCEWLDAIPESLKPSSFAKLPGDLTAWPIQVPFEATDPLPSSGLDEVELWAREPGSSAFELAAYADPRHPAYLYSQADGEYAVYTIAKDNSGNAEAAPPAPDVTFRVEQAAPTVKSRSPADGASRVSPSTTVSVDFSEDMDRASAERAFSLRASNGTLVSGRFSWSGTVMTFTPSRQLARSAGHTATVTAEAKDLAGKALGNPGSWSFTTS